MMILQYFVVKSAPTLLSIINRCKTLQNRKRKSPFVKFRQPARMERWGWGARGWKQKVLFTSSSVM